MQLGVGVPFALQLFRQLEIQRFDGLRLHLPAQSFQIGHPFLIGGGGDDLVSLSPPKQPASSSAEPITSPRASDISAIRRRVIWITRMVCINSFVDGYSQTGKDMLY